MNGTAVRFYEESRNIWGMPQIYKGISLYPIMLKDNRYIHLFYELFTHPKNYIPEKEIIKMSYLKFLVYVISSYMKMDVPAMENKLLDFLGYVLHTKQIGFEMEFEGETYDLKSLRFFLKVGEARLNEFDFDCLREIVLAQNGLSIEYVEEFKPELEKSLDFLMRKHAEITFEDEVTTFCALAGISLENAGAYTLYQYKKQYQRLLLLEEYRLYQPLLASGQVELKSGEIKHFGSHVKQPRRYDGLLISTDEFTAKHEEAFQPSKGKRKSKGVK